MRVLRILAVVLLVAGAADRALADDTPPPEALQAANELLSVLSPDMINQLTGQMFNAFWATSSRRRAPAIWTPTPSRSCTRSFNASCTTMSSIP